MADLDKLTAWRVERFEEIGFGPEMAGTLAAARDLEGWPVSYAQAEVLKSMGCPLALVARILL